MNDNRDYFFTKTEERNLCITVEGKNLFVNKERLAATSPVFCRMFFGDFKEAGENSVELKEKKLEDVLELFRVLFAPNKKLVDETNVCKLLALADEYDITDVKVAAENHLMNRVSKFIRNVDSEDIIRVLRTAVKYWYIEIIKACIPYACTWPDPLLKQYRSELPSSVMAAIFEAKYNKLNTERAHTLINQPSDHIYGQSGRSYTCPFCEKLTYQWQSCTKCLTSICSNCQLQRDELLQKNCRYRGSFGIKDFTFDPQFLKRDT